MCITRLASNEIFSPSNKIHREVRRAKDLSAPLYFEDIYIICGTTIRFRVYFSCTWDVIFIYKYAGLCLFDIVV